MARKKKPSEEPTPTPDVVEPTPTPKKTGRPGKLTPEIQAKICELLRGGNYRNVAARSCGVSAYTMARWMMEGEADKNSVFGEFRQAVLASETVAETEMVKVVVEAAKQDPSHAWQWLERKHHDRWSKNTGEIKLLRKQLADLAKAVEEYRVQANTSKPIAPVPISAYYPGSPEIKEGAV